MSGVERACFDIFIEYADGRERQFSARADTKKQAQAIVDEKNAHPARKGWTAVIYPGTQWVRNQ